jgi:Protein of unknown function (DUF4232)
MHLPTLSPRRLAGAAAAACAAALIPVAALAATASPASPAAPAAAASAPGCPTAGLVVWMNNEQGAAGTFYSNLNFTNLSGHTCTLRGHPGVSAVNLGGGRLGQPAAWPSATLPTVTLANGATATAVLAITDVGVFPPGDCHQVTAAGLRVYPPNQFTSKVVPYPFGACTTAQVFMHVGAVHKL